MRSSVFVPMLACAVAMAADEAPPGGSPHEHQHGSMDLGTYIARMEDPARDEWQKPDELVAALGLRDGDRVLDLGAGPGYFSLRLAKAVAPSGQVFAADIEPGMLQALRDRARQAAITNVTAVLVPTDDPTMQVGSLDLILICDTYHHLEDRGAYLAKLKMSLAPGGRLVIVDFHKKELPVGPPVEMKLTRDLVVEEVKAAGLSLANELTTLPYQYVLVFDR